jgi:hypothetical protein
MPVLQSLSKCSSLSTRLLASKFHHYTCEAFFGVLAMSDQGRFPIWKDDPALDNWYNVAVNRSFGLRNNDGNSVEEILFFDIAESNQVDYHSGASNEWFYDVAMDDNTIMKSKFHFCKCPQWCI